MLEIPKKAHKCSKDGKKCKIAWNMHTKEQKSSKYMHKKLKILIQKVQQCCKYTQKCKIHPKKGQKYAQ